MDAELDDDGVADEVAVRVGVSDAEGVLLGEADDDKVLEAVREADAVGLREGVSDGDAVLDDEEEPVAL